MCAASGKTAIKVTWQSVYTALSQVGWKTLFHFTQPQPLHSSKAGKTSHPFGFVERTD